MGYIGLNYGKYWAKTICEISGYSWPNIIGYIGPKLWDILWYLLVKPGWIYLAKLWDLFEKIWHIFGETMRYIGQTL